MTDLTEQWKKGELSEGWYYLELKGGEILIDLYKKYCDEWEDCYNYIIKQVLAPVPSYEEWKAKLEENKELAETNEALKAELKQVCDVLIRK